jgi:hypothetical protein
LYLGPARHSKALGGKPKESANPKMTKLPSPMTVLDLKGILERERFIPSTYSLTGGRHQDAYCLSYERGQWSVYYSERGEETDKVSFSSEGEACEYLLQKMRRDPGTKPRND